jgi:hypothetical protein
MAQGLEYRLLGLTPSGSPWCHGGYLGGATRLFSLIEPEKYVSRVMNTLEWCKSCNEQNNTCARPEGHRWL